MVLFILALEDAETLPALDAAAAVVSIWILMIASQWGLWIYLEAMA